MLQVWDKSGKKVLEDMPLVSKITKWCICYEYFVFKTDEVGSKHFQIMNLETKAVTLVDDFLGGDDSFEYFAFNDDKLYAASRTKIKIASIK